MQSHLADGEAPQSEDVLPSDITICLTVNLSTWDLNTASALATDQSREDTLQLSSSVIGVDLLGTVDTNRARASIATKYIKNSSDVWIVNKYHTCH
ncbi:hypothetical protein DAEQUDRAFT_724669 [Daedalea quercina L-15889]|uniref:Uncharacterized protein n=1 Tax=Daedalea quercina L-15889 TaxID=1314783 RepID=A0A165RLR9_9APHY|nr:hypothetical protein DAEQUDRAFT_724669 [Daedalea quercina L-15889]